MTTPQTHTRHATLQDMVALLRTNHARKVDTVAPVSALRSEGGVLVVEGAEPEITLDGVTSGDGRYLPTQVCDGGIASRLGIPPGYLATMRAKHVDLYDANVNGWFGHADNAGKKYLVRGFRADGGGSIGVGRALLSDSYAMIEDVDVLMTVLGAINEAGVEVQIRGCDLTDRRMYVQVVCEQVAINAYELVKNYRSPFSGQAGADLPMAFAGFEIGNSEVGHGRFSIAPRIELQVCKNGQTRRVDAFERQHLGGKLEAGVIKWSEETEQANLQLIRKMTVDAVRRFLSPEYAQSFVDDLTRDAGIPVTKPADTIKSVSAALRFSEGQQDAILAMFIKGGDMTTGGVMHAVTAAAQAESDADLAAEMEGAAFRVLSLAARAARADA